MVYGRFGERTRLQALHVSGGIHPLTAVSRSVYAARIEAGGHVEVAIPQRIANSNLQGLGARVNSRSPTT
jgi:hypothetical protein